MYLSTTGCLSEGTIRTKARWKWRESRWKRKIDSEKIEMYYNEMKNEYGLEINVFTYTTLIGIYGKMNDTEAVEYFIKEMQDNNIKFTKATYTALINFHGMIRHDWLQVQTLVHEMEKNRIKKDLIKLMELPGLSGYEDRVRKDLNQKLKDIGVATSTDRLGNLLATFPGEGPSIMLFTHMDQLGFIIRKIEVDGLLRIERLGGVPERALASQKVLIPIESGTDIPGVIANKSHHATSLDEKYTVLPYKDLFIDVGLTSEKDVMLAGIKVGSPVVFQPNAFELQQDRLAGTSIDDRAGSVSYTHLTLPTILLV